MNKINFEDRCEQIGWQNPSGKRLLRFEPEAWGSLWGGSLVL